jgi:hypothetical protein
LKKDFEIDNGFIKSDRDDVSCFYFGPEMVVSEECVLDTEKCVIKGIIPVPIRNSFRNDIEAALLNTMKGQKEKVMQAWNGAILADRDGGFLDNLSPVLKKWGYPDAKKKIYDTLKSGRSWNEYPNPYQCLLSSLAQHADVCITGMFLEIAESFDQSLISVGGAIIVAKKSSKLSRDLLTTTNFNQCVEAAIKSRDAKVINCNLDEIFGFHLTTKMPVVIPQTLYERVSVDGLLEMKGNDENNLFMAAPYFDSIEDENNWKAVLEASRLKPAKNVPTVDTIKDASTFLR